MSHVYTISHYCVFIENNVPMGPFVDMSYTLCIPYELVYVCKRKQSFFKGVLERDIWIIKEDKMNNINWLALVRKTSAKFYRRCPIMVMSHVHWCMYNKLSNTFIYLFIYSHLYLYKAGLKTFQLLWVQGPALTCFFAPIYLSSFYPYFCFFLTHFSICILL